MLLGAVAALLLTGSTAQPQSITNGLLEGIVLDSASAPFPGARIQVTERATGVSWWLSSDRAGYFRLPLLRPGEYDVFVEELGFQPVRIERVPIRPGGRQRLTMRLESVELPVNQVRQSVYEGSPAGSRAGESQWYGTFEINGLPEERRELTELGRLSTNADEELAVQGLPAWLSGVVVDGVPYAATMHPELSPGAIPAEAFPLSGFQAAELYSNAVDVEWSGSAGGYLSGHTRRGSANAELRAYADWSGDALTSSDFFSASELSANSYRGGAVLGGPIIRDTSHYVVGIDLRHLETPLPRPWEIDDFDAALLAVAQDSFGTDISAYTEPRVAEGELASAFGRFDWQIAPGHAISARANAAYLELGGAASQDPDLGPDRIASLGSRVKGADLSAAATLTSSFSRSISQELRVGIARGEREYSGTPVPATRIVDGGLGFGTDPTIPGEFERLALHFSETIHYFRGRHRLKAGVATRFESVRQRYTYARGGIFSFAGPDEFAGLRGAFEIAGGPSPLAEFSSFQIAAFLQDSWNAAPGLDVQFGIRYEFEHLDDGEVRLNLDWLERTGLANNSFDDNIRKFSARFGVLWDIAERHEWLVRGAAGIHHDQVGPSIFGELVTQNGSVDVRRGVGLLDSWPEAPSLGTASPVGSRLTLISPGFEPPRTRRASLGVTRLFEDGTAVHLSGAYRFTDLLPRRDDLNRPLAPTTRDQHGRPIFGTLVKEGTLIVPEPGSNRRFPDFDLVSALNADGSSSYWDATVAIERRAGPWLDLAAAYTYSLTHDDWLFGSGGPERQLNPFPDGLNGTDWVDGRSDFDAPHRAVIGVQLRLPSQLASARLAALYRFRSGRPFTPGFRNGVDVNGDGSGQNDPAFVDASIPGMDELIAKWDCLADQLDQFAERNSCRGPDDSVLDLRLALGLIEVQGLPVEVVLDALNLLDTDTGVRDRALFLIDRDSTLQTNPDGTITLPLVANQNFGETLVSRSAGRVLRLGIRVGL